MTINKQKLSIEKETFFVSMDIKYKRFSYLLVIDHTYKRNAKDTRGAFEFISLKQSDNAMAEKKRPQTNNRKQNTKKKTEQPKLGDVRCSRSVSSSAPYVVPEMCISHENA